MFKAQEEQLSILGVCVEAPHMIESAGDLSFTPVLSGRRAIDLLRITHFDFLLVGMRFPDITTWDFLRYLKTMWPQQKWALIGGPISEQQEVTARMFGATMLFDTTPSSTELSMVTARIRERAIESVLAGRFDPRPRGLRPSVRTAV